MINRSEREVSSGVKQFRCIRRLALDAEQDVESGGTGGGNCRVRVSSLWFHCGQYDGSGGWGGEIRMPSEPSLSPGSGRYPRIKSAAEARFLPSSCRSTISIAEPSPQPTR